MKQRTFTFKHFEIEIDIVPAIVLIPCIAIYYTGISFMFLNFTVSIDFN